MLRCAITNLSAYPLDSPAERWSRLRTLLDRWVVDRIDFIQLREKHLASAELFTLASAAMQRLRELPGKQAPRLLLNGRGDIAAAARTDGVHLSSQQAPSRSGQLTAGQLRTLFTAAGLPACTVSASCHALPEVEAASRGAVDLILMGPVFEKSIHGEFVFAGTGLPLLQAACALAGPVPVLALGGVTDANTGACLQAGARGVAGIRLFS